MVSLTNMRYEGEVFTIIPGMLESLGVLKYSTLLVFQLLLLASLSLSRNPLSLYKENFRMLNYVDYHLCLILFPWSKASQSRNNGVTGNSFCSGPELNDI